MRATLYTTLGCHLCEQALSLLYELQRNGVAIEIDQLDIADSDDLVEEYGIRIPVVRCGVKEIGWPFSLTELNAFLEDCD